MTTVKILPHILWASDFVRLVAVCDEGESAYDPMRVGDTIVMVEVERGRDLLGQPRWETISVWGDDPVSRGQFRAVVGALTQGLLKGGRR